MKYLLIISLFLLFATFSFAQDEVSDLLNSDLKDKNYFSMDITWNTWDRRPIGLDLKAYSRGYNFSFVHDFQIGQSKFGATVGLGIGTNNYYHDAFLSISNNDSASFYKIPDSISFKGTKLATTYVDIPLEFRFKTKADEPSKSVNIAIGFKAGILVSSMVKYKGFDYLTNSTNQLKVKFKDITAVNKYRYGITFRAGYSKINFFGYYALSTLFTKNKGLSIHPFSLGLTLTLP